jgi:hypothetical protein
MKPFDYFKKTFLFVFIFYTVYKFVYQLLEGISTITTEFIVKTLGLAFVTALILALINYYTQFDFFTRKKERKPKDN